MQRAKPTPTVRVVRAGTACHDYPIRAWRDVMEAAAQSAAHSDDRFAKLPHGLMDAVRRGVLSRDHAYVYGVLYRRRTYGTMTCRVRQAVLAEDAACTTRQWRRYTGELAGHGFVRISTERGQLTAYALTDQAQPRLEALPDPTTPRTPASPPSPSADTGDPGGADTGVPGVRTPVTLPTIQESISKSPGVQEPDTPRSSVCPDAGARPSRPARKDDRRTKLTEDFVPDERLIAWAHGKGLTDQQIVEVTEEFSSYWIGDGRPKLDWRATWRNRVLQVLPQLVRRSGRAVVVDRRADPNFSPVEARRRVDHARYGPDGFDEHGIDADGYDRDGWGPGGRAAGYSRYRNPTEQGARP